MKTKFLPYALMALTALISIAILFNGCKKSVGPIDPSSATYMYNLRGQVVDAGNNAGVANASVTVQGKRYVADINGYFTVRVSYATEFPFMIVAEAEGFLVGNSLVSGPSQVRAIRLTRENPAVVMNQDGGVVNAPSTESISGGGFILTFPANALSQAVSLSLTPMEEFYFSYGALEPTLKTGQSLIDLATISVSPYDVDYAKPVSLYCPLPFPNDKDTRFNLYRYDPTSDIWVNTGLTLNVDETRQGGTVLINRGGIYSVAGEGSFSEEKTGQTMLSTYVCQGDAPYMWQAVVEFPNGQPDNVNLNWLKNSVSHNSVLSGHVSFLKQTSTSIVCESYQPWSSHPVPNDEINLPSPTVCPSGTNPVLLDGGVGIYQRESSGVLTFISYESGAQTHQVSEQAIVQVPIHSYSWKCLHDQGGGK